MMANYLFDKKQINNCIYDSNQTFSDQTSGILLAKYIAYHLLFLRGKCKRESNSKQVQ